MLPTTEKKALSYIVLRELDPEVIEALENGDGPTTLDVVGDTIRTSAPGWVYYYLSEADESPDTPAEQLPSVIPKRKFIERAKDYAEKDNPVINLNTPAEHNWMSEDPLEHVRTAYEERLESIRNSIQSALADTNLDLTDSQLSSLTDRIAQQVDPLQWEVNRVRHREGENGKASDQTVAHKYVRSRKTLLKEVVDEMDIDVTSDQVEQGVESPPIRDKYRLPPSVQRKKVEKLREKMDDNPIF